MQVQKKYLFTIIWQILNGTFHIFTDSTELLPSLWEGSYICPDETSQTIQMNITKKKSGSIKTSAILALNGISVFASGTYGFGMLYIQNDQTNQNVSSVTLRVTQPSNNLTTMGGLLKIDEKKCSVTLNMQKCE